MSTFTSVVLGNSIQELSISCFENDVKLKEIDISHIKTIGEKCFYCCVELSAITLGEVLSVGLSSFYDAFSIKYVKNLGTKNLNTLINLSSSQAFNSIHHKLLITQNDINLLNNSQQINAF
ncbi:hypothetical protein EIN_502420 [Entamoeba invadens IP1]|uniref:Leucine rich repeat containing protein BspA family protein n=1 Tax=Entamoeba invadens IP1 TaxID=370355 RepID=A0A0A1TZP7_ENTIV|nr:hypothetical protein EIN_502420 [Entamoeba invadens IP1]ELP84109.1 hypothetical protein EIN_502420 [Entamoeba invadens IP1]|eukprot:XP_004183455.1 hypothetical protein EIN_502420 [Entamoeba invadens IP1]